MIAHIMLQPFKLLITLCSLKIFQIIIGNQFRYGLIDDSKSGLLWLLHIFT